MKALKKIHLGEDGVQLLTNVPAPVPESASSVVIPAPHEDIYKAIY